MKTARLLVLGVALAAGLGAALLVSNSKPPEPVKEIVRAPVMQLDDVLIAGKELAFGSVLQDDDLHWQSWPKDNIPPNFVRKSTAPNAIAELKGAIARSAFAPGEPIQQDRLVKPGTTGFMSAMLAPGQRALAIPIEPNGTLTAGGFILPNDRVDVIRTYKDEAAAREGVGDPFLSETIARNVRVLAIGQNVQERNNEKVVVGPNATLELTPQQAEVIALAQRVAGSTLSLALRGIADKKVVDEAPSKRRPDMVIIRNGIATQGRAH
ncbi:MAG: Flp pilus assembly protein CpaB [Beijerinckiaceae bacterium]